jgi:SSS family solute:Na+ symporter
MASRIGVLDGSIVVAYLAAVLVLSWLIARRQRSGTDYFLAGRSMSGPILAFSILANQISAVSLIGAPAFVALRQGGGLSWLQYEMALPLAMLAAIVLLVPALRALPGASIYEFAERRFGPGSRRVLAAAFLLSRGLALGVILYASALVVSEALGWPIDGAIIAIGVFALVYTSMGGIVADIWSDVIQLGVLLAGVLAGIVAVFLRHGREVIAAIPIERAQAIVAGSGLEAGGTFSFWPMLLGGFFLYLSYYTCDQSQAQRLLTARSDGEARDALFWNGILRFPLVLTYCLLGLLLAGLLVVDADFSARVAGRPADSLVPVFMLEYVPVGMRGLMLAGLLAAAMSSIDSAMNSLAAVTMEDVLRKDPGATPVRWGRIASVCWGFFSVGSAMLFARGGSGVLETINLIGSAFYGPILSVFLLGVLTRGVTGRGAITGLLAGLVGNLLLARLAPGISWLWWNPAGFLVGCAVALMLSPRPIGWIRPSWRGSGARVLLPVFVIILALLALAPRLIAGIAGH